MATKDIVVIGSSSGGIEALRTLVSSLPKEYQGSVFIVQHTSADSPGILDLILSRAGQLPTSTARDKDKILPGHIYVAPPDRHLLLEPDRIRLSRGPKENRFRPAIDPLFRSAAQVYGPRVIGVILTGGLDDGTAGLWAIKQLGGTAIVQDPADALEPSMPVSALKYVNVDYRVPVAEIGSLLVSLGNMRADMEGVYEMPEHLEIEVKIAKQDPAIDQDVRQIWETSSYTCPECHGVLLRFKEGGRERFRCHTGHAFSADSLLAYMTDDIENALWTAIRSIEEGVLLLDHLSKHLEDVNPETATQFRLKAAEARLRSELVRKAVIAHEELNVERVMEAAKD